MPDTNSLSPCRLSGPAALTSTEVADFVAFGHTLFNIYKRLQMQASSTASPKATRGPELT